MRGSAAGWDDRTELLAVTVDRLGHIDYLLQRAHFKGSSDPPPLVPRPGDTPNGKVGELPETLEEAAAFFRANQE